jgi:hypothetical protein
VDVTQLPFHRLLGLKPAGGDSEFVVMPQYLNHLGTVHAGALLAAEAGSSNGSSSNVHDSG